MRNITDYWIKAYRQFGGFGIIAALILLCISVAICQIQETEAATSNKMVSEWGTNHFDKAIIDIHKEIIEVDVKKMDRLR